MEPILSYCKDDVNYPVAKVFNFLLCVCSELTVYNVSVLTSDGFKGELFDLNMGKH